MPITVDFSDVPLADDAPEVFTSKATALVGKYPQFAADLNALEANVNAKEASAVAAALAASVTASMWVSGTTYAIGDVRWSPVSYLAYRRKTVGAGTVDPSQDATNWAAQSERGRGLRNVLHNGEHRVFQRGAAVALASTDTLVYVTDRWLCSAVGAATTATQQSNLVHPNGTKTACAITGAAGLTVARFQQRIESADCRSMAGRPFTLSFWLYHAAGAGVTVSATLRRPPTDDDFAATSLAEYTGAAQTAVSGTVTQYTFTGVLGASATTGLFVTIHVAGALSSGLISMTEAQFEADAMATDFERRPYALELALCRRYLHIFRAPSAGNTGLFSGHMHTATQGNFAYAFPTPMRVPPSITHSGVSNFRVQSKGSAVFPTGLAFQGISEQGCMPYATLGSSLTAGDGAALINEFGPTQSYIVFSAEL